jgi:hypothetical protein
VLPPRLTPWSVPAPDAPRPSGDHAGLGIRVEDVTGGPIPGALVSTGGDGGRALGRTDEDGWIRIEASGLPAVIRVVARGEGYTEHSALAPVPGDTVIRLVPASRVSGRVIERGEGRPVPGLTVSCEDQQTQSSADGSFALAGVSPGRHRIEARGEGWSGTLAEPFDIGPADVVRDLLIQVTRAFALGGQVVSRGRGLSGRTVELTAPGSGRRSAVSDGDGDYRFVGLPPATYQVRVTSPRGMPTLLGAPISIVDRDLTLVIDLGQRERLAFTVVDRSGRPISGIAVHVSQKHDNVEASPFCTSDAAGSCTVTDLWPGPLTYETDSQPRRPAKVPSAAPVRIVVEGVGGIRGQLVRRDERPVGERYVIASRRDGPGRGTVHSDDQGRFEMSQLPLGRYEIEVYLRNPIPPRAPREASVEVSVEPDRTTEVVLELPATTAAIAGVVVDQQGRAVADALVTYDHFDLSGGTSTFARGLDLSSSDDRGAFRFPQVLAHYHYRLTAYTRDGRLGTAEDVAAGATDVLLRLERLVDLTVEVRGFRAAVTVAVRRGDRIEAISSGDAAGTYRFDNLRPGPVLVTATAGQERAEAAAVLDPGGATRVQLGPTVR